MVVPDLPPKMIIDIPCPLTTDQKRLYAKVQKGLKISDDSLEDDLIKLRAESTLGSSPSVNPLIAMMRLNMLCVHPLLVDETMPSELSLSGKLTELAKLLIGSGVVTHDGNPT